MEGLARVVVLKHRVEIGAVSEDAARSWCIRNLTPGVSVFALEHPAVAAEEHGSVFGPVEAAAAIAGYLLPARRAVLRVVKGAARCVEPRVASQNDGRCALAPPAR